MKIRKIGEALPTPNQRMAIGIQAIGEIGRSIWKIGFSVVNAPRDPAHPQAQRNGDQRPRAGSRLPTRNSDAPMCSHSVPSCDQLDRCRSRPATASERSTLCVATTTSPPRTRSAAPSPPADGKSLLEPVHFDSLRPGYVLAVSSSCTRQRSRAHGDAGHGSTTMVICPLACAVQANCSSRPPRTAAGSSGPASSASARRSAARRRDCAAAARR